MVILEYTPKNHKHIVKVIAVALKYGKIVAMPTDTSYGFIADSTNVKAIKKLYKTKQRDFKKPIHIFASSKTEVIKLVKVNSQAKTAMRKLWPGACILILPSARVDKATKLLSANTGYIGIRIPDNRLIIDVVKLLDKAITATSANVSGKPDCYSGDAVISQFRDRKVKPDILIYVRSIPKRKPSAMLKISNDAIELVREGSMAKQTIQQKLKIKF